MIEKTPTPITKGIEIQKNRVEESREKSLDLYRRLVKVDAIVSEKIDRIISTPASDLTDDQMTEIVELIETSKKLDEISIYLDDLLLETFREGDILQDRWDVLEMRIAEFDTKK